MLLFEPTNAPPAPPTIAPVVAPLVVLEGATDEQPLRVKTAKAVARPTNFCAPSRAEREEFAMAKELIDRDDV
jgi:hypothetical protein